VSRPARTHVTFNVKTHLVELVRLDGKQWRVVIDGKNYATFCSESRARVAGRTAAQLMAFGPLGT